jgi:hypothetical protein
MSARTVAVTALLWHHQPDLQCIKRLATAEMRALAPAVLAAAGPTETLAHPASQPAP